MFTWDESTPKTWSASPTNQLEVSLSGRATTLHTIKVSVNSSRWTSPDIGMITVRGKRSEEDSLSKVPTKLWLDRNTAGDEKGRGLPEITKLRSTATI